jgi:hypothetical protein
MRAPVVIAGAVLVALGLSVFAWKAFVLDMPLQPSNPEGMWRVDLEIRVRGTGSRGGVLAALPSSEPGQQVFGESAVSDRLQYSVREREGERRGVWRGALSGVHELGHSFRSSSRRCALRC